jgi:hypothetical protein
VYPKWCICFVHSYHILCISSIVCECYGLTPPLVVSYNHIYYYISATIAWSLFYNMNGISILKCFTCYIPLYFSSFCCHFISVFNLQTHQDVPSWW